VNNGSWKQKEADLSLLLAARDANVTPYVTESGLRWKQVPSQNETDVVDDSEGDSALSARRSRDENAQSTDRDESGDDECRISLNKTFVQHLQSLGPIPKKVHIFFPDKDYWKKSPIPFIEHSILNLKRLNPDWNVTVYDEGMIDNVIRKGVDSNLIRQEECDILVGSTDRHGNVINEAAHIMERLNIARLILLYTEGGFYMDADKLVSNHMDDVIQPTVTRMCLPTNHDVNFCHDVMCTSPKNELFLFIIQEASNFRLRLKRRKGWIEGGALSELGPVLYNKQILIHVFGGTEDTYYECEESGIPVARELITAESDGVVVTKREDGCDGGLLFDDTVPLCDDLVTKGKDELYNAYGMDQWRAQVNARWAVNQEG